MATNATLERRSFEGLSYTLVRSGRRKTAAILVEPNGDVTVRVPSDLPDTAVDELLRSRRSRVLHAVRERSGPAEPQSRRFAEGERVPLLGADYPVHLVDDADAELAFDGTAFHLRRCPGVSASPTYQAAFRRFYTAVGKQDLAARVDRWSAVLDVEPAAVRVLDLKNRWGSCSPKGAVNFHWRTLMAPPHVIDYLVVHELAHLRVPDHSRGFWRLVEGVMPDHAEQHAWLRERGAEMDL